MHPHGFIYASVTHPYAPICPRHACQIIVQHTQRVQIVVSDPTLHDKLRQTQNKSETFVVLMRLSLFELSLYINRILASWHRVAAQLVKKLLFLVLYELPTLYFETTPLTLEQKNAAWVYIHTTYDMVSNLLFHTLRRFAMGWNRIDLSLPNTIHIL